MPNDYKALMQALIDGGVDIDPKSVSEEYLLNAIRSSGIEGLPEPKSRLDAYLGALVKHIKEGGSSGSSGSSGYSRKSIMSLNSIDHSMTIEDCSYEERATYFEVYYEFNNEELNKFDLRETDFLLTLTLGNEIFKISRANTNVCNGDPDNDAADEYYLQYGSWDEEEWNFEEGSPSLCCVAIDLWRQSGDKAYVLDVYGTVKDSVADNISFTIDIFAHDQTLSLISSAVSTAKQTADEAYETADEAYETAYTAKKTADTAKETADTAKETADAAMVKASDAKRELSNLVRKQTLECPLELDGLRGIQIGEAYKVTTDGQMFIFLFPQNAMLRVRFTVRDDNSIGFIYAILTTSDSYEATGFFNWQPENENNRVFVVRMTNYASTSYVEMLRLA